jgi:ParB-like chromosome segregation protein Spo0J
MNEKAPQEEPIAVHPAADLFPMLSDERLQDLAESIKAKGLQEAILLQKTADGALLIDGRNRSAACKIAGVKPRYEYLPDGVDPIVVIETRNIDRRDLNQGQRAILRAKLHPEAKPGRPTKEMANNLPFLSEGERTMLSNARLLLKHAPGLADEVLHNGGFMTKAVEKARVLKQEADLDKERRDKLAKEAPDLAALEGVSVDEALAILERRKVEATQLAILQGEEPELAKQVEKGQLTIAEANTAAFERQQKKQHARESSTQLLSQIVRLIDPESEAKPRAEVLMRDVDPRLWLRENDDELTPDLLRSCAAILKACAEFWAKTGGKHG